MAMVYIFGILFLLCTTSLFVLPANLWGSLENYCLSIIIRIIAAIVCLYLAVYPYFGKEQIGRWFIFVSVSLGISVTAAIILQYLDANFGFFNTLLILGTLTLLLGAYLLIEKFKKG